jgi:hypothetical protein
VPSVPIPKLLVAGYSSLCPNFLNRITNSAWNVATGQTPWYKACTCPLGEIWCTTSRPQACMRPAACAGSSGNN